MAGGHYDIAEDVGVHSSVKPEGCTGGQMKLKGKIIRRGWRRRGQADEVAAICRRAHGTQRKTVFTTILALGIEVLVTGNGQVNKGLFQRDMLL